MYNLHTNVILINMKFIDLKNFKNVKNLKIDVIGYGIQGSACALNLRDNKFKVYVHQFNNKKLNSIFSKTQSKLIKFFTNNKITY